MHSSKRLGEQPRAHRLDRINCCALSDCCGAPIIQGGICFDCREHCEEENGDLRPARFSRTSTRQEDRRAFAHVERPDISFLEEDSSGLFDGFSLRSVSD